MITGLAVVPRGEWSEAADTITLGADVRDRRRMAMVSDGGIAFLLDLTGTRRLGVGDAIRLDDGRLVEVRARPEPLIEISGRDTDHLLSLAWAIGSHHVAAEFSGGHIRIREAEGLHEFLEGLGARIERVEAGFDPEADIRRAQLPPRADGLPAGFPDGSADAAP
ncbi:urease accessory protein UreE [Fulvimarina endophytica]|uniref:Urease accessory protein UreE n=1 Tax=Fulvimarina endophytica TaxID=2293836 RepID=A0A371X4L9_9HYPH|nr:urease accessory protein UreE [Fulvimarina endophytica]RFC64157.1 urease accessory protein UreE [Fulvimarina endophytica]